MTKEVVDDKTLIKLYGDDDVINKAKTLIEELTTDGPKPRFQPTNNQFTKLDSGPINWKELNEECVRILITTFNPTFRFTYPNIFRATLLLTAGQFNKSQSHLRIPIMVI